MNKMLAVHCVLDVPRNRRREGVLLLLWNERVRSTYIRRMASMVGITDRREMIANRAARRQNDGEFESN